MKKSKESLRDLWDTQDKYTHYMSPRKKRLKEAESWYEEIMAENVLIVGKEMDTQLQEAQQTKLGWAQKRPH